jgi:hypothetical protein
MPTTDALAVALVAYQTDIVEHFEITEYDNIQGSFDYYPPFLNEHDPNYITKLSVINRLYIESERFCYHFLYYVKRYNNEDRNLLQIASEIAKYYNIKYAYYKYFGRVIEPDDRLTFDMNNINTTPIKISNTETKTIRELFNITTNKKELFQ